MKPQKIKVDLGASMREMVAASETHAENRFAKAAQVLQGQPSALTTTTAAIPSPAPKANSAPTSKSSDAFDVNALVVGTVYAVPLTLIDPNPRGVRVLYKGEDVEVIVESFGKNGQEDAAHGFVRAGRIVLTDGGTRLRGARASGASTLDIKIEDPPSDERELFKRSRRLNEERSNHTELDMAINIHRLLVDKVYESADALADDLGMSKGAVSMYRRVAQIPMRLLTQMNNHDKTSGQRISYEISGLFVGEGYAGDPDRYTQIAEDVIEEIQKLDLPLDRVKALIAAKVDGPKTRQRPEALPIKFGGKTGTLKVFPERGQVDLSLKGLTPEAVEHARDMLEKLFAETHPHSTSAK